ncbi:MAG: undecaprenyl/decaprenyl-phosphate alpha-N-acetylglucosaminyl 1-phosphate transferase [Candidatus Marinimicrobia bacterium]|nr:undecaprenyl/decaprenyl-phosphate alpha-N-acetylglucosaminyl 1-phosphate transferase [Candidatus Neomarinimicrobiota bacterium]MBL7023334.1 undecaprenyl/decaprenyl-phosphate alpha-N-acetylglucosaminyl 1-phosphate transferase [Candidatus Neomarinimicrobiota bacterium]
MNYLLIILVPFLLTMLMMPIGIKILTHLKVMDLPDHRKVHDQPIPSTGGGIFFISFVLTIIFFFIYQSSIEIDLTLKAYFVGVTFLVIIGIADDVKPVSASYKFSAQLLAAFLFTSLTKIHLTIPYLGEYPIVSFIIIILFIVGITNSINLIDGMDGLAAGISIIALGFLAFFLKGTIYFPFILIMLSVIFGFLRANTFPAMIFMGDGGSYFLGYSLAIFSLISVGNLLIPIWFPILILGIPILDTTLVFIKRIIERRSIFSPDKNHIHHRFLKKGVSHKNAVFLLYSLQALIAMIGWAIIFDITKYYWWALTILVLLTLQHGFLILRDDVKKITVNNQQMFTKIFDKIPLFKRAYVLYFLSFLVILSGMQIHIIDKLSGSEIIIIFISLITAFLFIVDHNTGRSSNVSIGMIILAGLTMMLSYPNSGLALTKFDNFVWIYLVLGVILSSIGMYKKRHFFDSPTEYLLIIIIIFASLNTSIVGLAYTSLHLVILFLVYKILLQDEMVRKHNIIYILNILTLCIMILLNPN